MKHNDIRYVLVWCLGCLIFQGTPVVAGANEWTSLGRGLTAEVNAFGQHPANDQKLYAATRNGFYHSADGGATWALRGPSLIDRNVLSLAVDPENGERLFAGLNTGLFRSEDGGESWSAVSAVCLLYTSPSPRDRG